MLRLAALLCAAQPDAARLAVERAPTPAHTHARLERYEGPRDCAGELTVQPLDASGRVPVRVRGPACEAWGWATVTLLTDAVILTRDVRAGEPLDGAWTLAEVEVRRGREYLTAVAPGSTAERALKAGAPLEVASVRVGPPPGTAITVRVVGAGLSLEQRGTIAACRGGRVCANLPSGKRVTGELVDGVLVAALGGTP